MKRTKTDKHVIDIWQHMETYQGFIDILSGTTKSIGIQCGKIKELPEEIEGNVMLSDLIREYNRVENIRYTKAYAGCFISQNANDAGKYIARFKKEVFKAVNRKYATGYSYANMKQDDLLYSLNTFFALLRG